MALPMMDFRRSQLQMATDGYERTGMPLVAYDGTDYAPAGSTDDVGLYYFVPQIADGLGIGVEGAYFTFLHTIVFLSTLLGIVGSLLYFRTAVGKFTGVILTLFGAEVCLRGGARFLLGRPIQWGYGGGEVYFVALCSVFATLPLFLYLVRRAQEKPKATPYALAAFLVLAAVFLATMNVVRSHAGTPVLVFMAMLVALSLPQDWRIRASLVAGLVAGALVPAAILDVVVQNRDAFLLAGNPNYVPVSSSHPIWHSIYISLGYTHNPFGLAYSDAVAGDLVLAARPDAAYLSPEYEAVVRNEVFYMVRFQWPYVVQVVFAKAGVMIMFFLWYANIGILAERYYPKPRPLEWSFWGAIAFSSLPGILGMPFSGYVLTFIGLALMYCAVSVEEAVARGGLARVYERVVPTVRIERSESG